MALPKIAYIFTPIEFGGAAKVAYNFLSNVDRSHFDVHPVVLIRPWERENSLIRSIEKSNNILHRIPVTMRPKDDGSDYFRVIRSFRILYRILSRDHFDLVHSHGYFADIIGAAASRLLSIPHLSTCHGFVSTDINLKIYNMLDLIALRFCRKVIAVSKEIRTSLLNAGIRSSRIEVIENAVEYIHDASILAEHRKNTRGCLASNGSDHLIGYVGRISTEKGLEYLIEAISILTKKNESCKLLIIGEGRDETQLKYLVRRKNLTNSVIFVGFQERIEEWLPALDVFVLSSLTEGTPMALLEAMANGIPVVATTVGGIPSIISDKENGLLVEPARPDELAKGIGTLLSDTAMRERLSAAAIDTIVKKYDLGSWVRRIESLYLEVLGV